MPDRARPEEPLLDLPEDEALAGEHLDNQVQRAQEQLLALNRQRDLIERQKRELEELSRRQDQFQQGKTEMTEKLTRALVILEREHYAAQKRVETLHQIRDSFTQHLDVLDAINSKSWDELDIQKELTRALGAVDDARTEYSRALPKIGGEADGAGAEGGRVFPAEDGSVEIKDFTYWLKAGFAFTLPLFAVGVLLVIVLVTVFNR